MTIQDARSHSNHKWGSNNVTNVCQSPPCQKLSLPNKTLQSQFARELTPQNAARDYQLLKANDESQAQFKTSDAGEGSAQICAELPSIDRWRTRLAWFRNDR